MLIHNHYHLTYCTNVHAGESWTAYFNNLQQYLPDIKSRISPEEPFGVGLRLSAKAAEELMLNDYLEEFKRWLSKEGLYVFTINGFSYGNFHDKVVKSNVYKPDWSTQERVRYTKNLCHILAHLLPQGMEGSISTSPLSYKPWLQKGDQELEELWRISSLHLALIVEELIKIKTVTGKDITIAIEPEPDGLLENTSEIISFYDYWLLPVGSYHLNSTFGYSQEVAQKTITKYISICYDVCHFALTYENPEAVFTRLEREGIRIGKIQISSALRLMLNENNKASMAQELSKFVEERYLHQVVERDKQDVLTLYSDLPEALESIGKPGNREWRIHYHVPVFVQHFDTLQSTQSDILEVLRLLKKHQLTSHLEVETYTWDVLPEELKTDLPSSIQRELQWVAIQIEHCIYERSNNGHA